MGTAIVILIAAIAVFLVIRKIIHDREDKEVIKVTAGLGSEVISYDAFPDEEYLPSGQDGTPGIVVALRKEYKGQSLNRLSELYFSTGEKLFEAEKRHDYTKMLMYCQLSYGLIEPVIKYTKKNYGSWDIKGIPAISKGLIYNAIYGNTGQLKNIQDMVNHFKELDYHQEDVKAAFKMRDAAAKIYKYVKDNPNCLQSELKKKLTIDDGRLIANTVHYMENVNKISKCKEGNKMLLKVK